MHNLESLSKAYLYHFELVFGKDVDKDKDSKMKHFWDNLGICLIQGECDSITPVSESIGFTKSLTKLGYKNTRLYLVKNCGHLPHEECPKETNEIILNFINKLNLDKPELKILDGLPKTTKITDSLPNLHNYYDNENNL